LYCTAEARLDAENIEEVRRYARTRAHSDGCEGDRRGPRAAVWGADRDIPVPEERTLEQIVSASLARRRFQVTLVFVFAVAALALAAFGTYGVVTYSVSRRRAEIGIRLALGAGKARVLRLMLRQGMAPVFAGLAAGGLAALTIGRYVSSLLFEVSPHDPVAFTGAALVLIAVSALACWVPARRAAGLNPLDAIRYEGRR
jgi:ABC-type antimicrobial peptide transport system permease subunit